jgi:hypothetical protein
MMSHDPFTTDIPMLHRFLDQSDSVINWLYPGMPGTVFIACRLGAKELSEVMHAHMGPLFFYIAEISQHSIGGWASSEIWDFIHPPLKFSL